MPSARAWIESRHLRESAEGAAALAALENLPPGLAGRVLARGDAIAASSVSLAHAFFSRAVQAAAAGPMHFAEWERGLLELAGEQAPVRELALSYLSLPPAGLAAWDAATRDAWTAAVKSLATSSRRLATAFVDATAGLLAASADDNAGDPEPASPSRPARPASRPRPSARETFGAWLDGAGRLLAQGGWRSEFLAEAFVTGAGRLAGLLDPEAVGHWADLVAALGSAGRSPRPPQPPTALLPLPPASASAVLALAAAAARSSTKAAQRLLDSAPEAVGQLAEADAATLLRACARCPSFDALADSMGLVGGVLHGVKPAALPFLLEQVTLLADEAPVALPAFLRTMDRALDEGGEAGVALWTRRGIDAARGGAAPEAVVAHFRLETRTSHKLLVDRSAAVGFAEVDGMLRRYLTMMSRRSFQLTSSPGLWMRPPLVAPEDVAVRLPERVDLFDSSDDNQAVYKAIATHIAARFEYGTYDLDLGELVARGWAPPAVPEDDASPRDVIAFVGCFPNPLLASALFVLLEGIRVDACLERDFRGLRAELARVGRLYAGTVVPAAQDRHPNERLLETLFQMGVARREVHELEPRLREQGAFLAASIALLRSPEASVYDSAALTVAYYGGLAFAEARATEDSDEVAFAEMGGATVVDPFEHLDGDERRENTAPWRPDPSKAVPGEQAEGIKLRLDDDDGTPSGGTRPVSLEELKALLERGGDMKISEAHGRVEEGLGLFVTDLLGKIPAEQMRELREKLAAGDGAAVRAWLSRQAAGSSFWYDEWDWRLADYRRRWCRVVEVPCDEDAGEYFAEALARSGELVGRIKRDLQILRPDQLRRVPRTEHGEELDINALVEAHSDRRGRRTPSDRLYVARKPEERDVATLFLIDMSASTDEPLAGQPPAADGAAPRRVIDLTRDTLAVLAQVLGEIGDSYAIYGFSGHGRDNVEIYPVKSFQERLSDSVKSRIGGIAPKRSTRMGAALRHAGEKLARTTARARHLILLSDGFPQDFDYGDDRRSSAYGLRDTMQALRELEKRGVQTFCITVDPAGHDYLGEMCPTARYAVLDDIQELPSELMRIYRRVTRS